LLDLAFGPGEGFVRQVFESQQPICIDDVHADYRVPYDNQNEEVTTVLSAISAPLTVKGEKIGVISLDNASRTAAFTGDDLKLLVSFASSAAVAIQNSRLFGQTNRRAEELGALAQVSAAFRTATTRTEMIPVILNQIADVFGIDDAALLSYNPSTGENVVEVAHGKWMKAVGMQVLSGQGVSSVVVQTHLPFSSDNVVADERFAAKSLFREPEAVVGIPLLVQKQILGSLWMGRRKEKGQTQPLPFADEEVRLLGSIADMTANALHRARLHEQAIRHAEQMVTVNEVGHLLSETLELDQIYSRLARAIHNLMPDVCALFISLYDERTRTITCTSAYVDGAFVDVQEFPPLPFDPEGSGHQSRVLLTGLPLIVNGSAAVLEEKPHAKPAGDPQQKPESALYVPLFSKGASIGLIQVQSYTPNRFEEQDVNLLTLVANTAAVTIENARLFVETQKRLRYLSALHNIDAAIGASVDLRVTLSIILENVTKELNVDAAAVLLMNIHTKTLEYTASRGFRVRLIEGMRIRLGEGLAGQAAIQRRLVSLADAGQAGLDLFSEEGFAVQYAVPLLAKGQVQGVLQVFHRSALEPDMEWTNFLNTLAGQAAIAMDNARLFEDLQRSNLELTLAYDATIQGWSQAMELRDKETQGHTERVTELTMRLAREIGLGDTETVHLRRGVLLHDIGKMGVPDSILLKPGSLTPEEWEIMRLHPVYAHEMLSNIPYLQQAVAVPYCHHEKWDGTGYPRGLKGEQIPLTARMFAMVDVYEALTSDRPYRAAWSRERALEYLREQSGKHFDPHVLEAFLRLEL
jgi:HD-GYP domain-containing protein (c-di-GMP phosphodiesterase class II)